MKTKLLVLLMLSLPLLAKDANWERCKQHVKTQLPGVHGWCTSEKADKMMELIKEVKPKVCVEIGVYGGASILPTATALKFNRKGIVYAIDPWDNKDCLVGYTPDNPNYKWWNEQDMKMIFDSFRLLLIANGLNQYCKPMKTTSAKALAHFENESICILHIDGNHTEDAAYFDASKWFPKVKPGGYIWFDDVNWGTTNKAVFYLLDRCTLVESRSIQNACLLFRKD